MECPKCKYVQPDAAECVSCGIIIDKYNPERKVQIPETYTDVEPDKIPIEKNMWIIAAIAVAVILVLCFSLTRPQKLSDDRVSAELVPGTPESDYVIETDEAESSGFNYAKQIQEVFPTTTPFDTARNATVTVKSQWMTGHGFFINDQGLIITSKRLVHYEKVDGDPVWEKQKRLIRKLEQDTAIIENLEQKLSFERLRENTLKRTKKRLDEKRESVANAEEQLSLMESPVKVILIDGTELETSEIHISSLYDAAVLILDNVQSPFIKPIKKWPDRKYFLDVLDNRETIYLWDKKKDDTKSGYQHVTLSPMNKNKKCCYSMAAFGYFEHFSVGLPLLNKHGEALGLSHAETFNGRVTPILSIVEEFDDIINSFEY